MYKLIIKKENALQVSVLVAGFTALLVQVVYLREFMVIFQGNELVSGIILANWMILTAAGAFAGGYLRGKQLSVFYLIFGQVGLALLPAISLIALYWFRVELFPPGTLPGFYQTWIYSAVFMLPFCLLAGWLFAGFLKMYRQLLMTNKASEVYAWEAIGAVIGGLLFTFLMIRIFTTFQILILVSASCFAAAIAIVLAWKKSRNLLHGLISGMLIWLLMVIFINPDELVQSMVFPGQTIIVEKTTPYGDIVVTEKAGQLNFFENGISLFSTSQVIKNEESVHYAMLQHADPKNVLVVSGGLTGIAAELRKYNIRQADYLDVNPFLIVTEKDILDAETGDKIKAFDEDPVRFIRETQKTYDVALLNVAPPSSLQLNRFYSTGFFKSLKNIMTDSAVVSVSIGGSSNYLGEESLAYYSIMVKTMKQLFEHVKLVPGQSNFLLASDAPLDYNFSSRSPEVAETNEFVNPNYMDSELMQFHADQLLRQLDPDAPLNRNFRPKAYFAQISYWLSWYGLNPEKIFIPLAIFFVLVLIILRTPDKAMFSAGFTASATEVIVLLVFQVIFGYLYLSIGLLIAVFMCGLALGALLSKRRFIRINKASFVLNQSAIALVSLIVPAFILLEGSGNFHYFIATPVLYLTMLLSGILTGLQFTLAWKLKSDQGIVGAASAYGFDLLGSAAGAILAVALIIPWLGLVWSGIFLCGLNLLTSFLIMAGNKKLRIL